MSYIVQRWRSRARGHLEVHDLHLVKGRPQLGVADAEAQGQVALGANDHVVNVQHLQIGNKASEIKEKR